MKINEITQQEKQKFLDGDCIDLAYVLAQELHVPYITIIVTNFTNTNKRNIRHAFVEIGNDKAVDILGITSFNNMLRKHKTKTSTVERIPVNKVRSYAALLPKSDHVVIKTKIIPKLLTNVSQ